MSLKKRNIFELAGAAVLLTLLSTILPAQRPAPAPRQEKLLNGLKVLIWNQPASEHVTIKLRIHSGSAFDPQEREGVMKMLSEGFFPTRESRAFFSEELGGSLDIVCNYDFIQVTARARNEEFLTVLETMSQSILGPEIGRDATAGLRAAVLAQLKEVENDPAYIADMAVAKRLFGTFPYGRPVMGTTATLERIDFADLRFAKDRLLTADNATLSIEGRVDPATAYRAARRFLGSWIKSDRKVPSTFRQPDPPTADVHLVDLPGENISELRFAVRGLSRSDPDHYAAAILSKVLEQRLRGVVGQSAFVRNDSHTLPGSFVFGSSAWHPAKGNGTETADGLAASVRDSVLKDAVTAAELNAAQRAVLAELAQYDTSEMWLDADTYRFNTPARELEKAGAVRLADVQRVLGRLQKEPFAFVRVRSADGRPADGN